MARAVRPGGRVAVRAFSAYFQVRYLEERTRFDADAGVNHERTEVRDEDGRGAEVDLWTTCFTPRELRLLAAAGRAAGRRTSGRSTPGRLRGTPARRRHAGAASWSPRRP